MDGIKLIDASEVTVKKKTSKIEIQKVSKPIKIITESPLKIITDAEKQHVVESTVGKDTKTSDERVDKLPQDTVDRVIRAIKLEESIYYGPKNANKNKFMRMYKKLGLTWMENISIDGMIVNGWFNKDRSQYIIKLLEEGDFKRFKFYGCDGIYDYFISLGAVTFDYTKEITKPQINIGTNVTNVNIGEGGGVIVSSDIDISSVFIGADLDSRYRTRQLLKKMPENWGVKWK